MRDNEAMRVASDFLQRNKKTTTTNINCIQYCFPILMKMQNTVLTDLSFVYERIAVTVAVEYDGSVGFHVQYTKNILITIWKGI